VLLNCSWVYIDFGSGHALILGTWILNLLRLLVNVVELFLDVHGFWEWAQVNFRIVDNLSNFSI
jgi:hypothetical protein